MALRTKLVLGLTFLLGIGVGLLLQSCGGIPGSPPIEGTPTVGGGVTGTWIGAQTGEARCESTGVQPNLVVVFIALSDGSLIGSMERMHPVDKSRPIDAGAVYGKIVGSNIKFSVVGFAPWMEFDGSLQDTNRLSGVWETQGGIGLDSATGCEGGSWLLQRGHLDQ